MGRTIWRAGDPIQPQAHLEACLAYQRTENRVSVVVASLCKLGYAAQMQSDLSWAASLARVALELARVRHYRRAIAKNLYGVAGLALAADYLTAQNVAMLRERLDAQTLAACWAEGRALDWEQAVEEALAFAKEIEAGGRD